MEELRMKKHVSVVGGLQIGFGIFWLLVAIFLFFVLSFVKGAAGDEDEIGRQVLNLVSLILPGFIGFLAVLGIIGGVGLLSYKQWGRIMVIIVAGLGCLNIPIGTLVGVYSIWVLMQDDTMKLFEKQ
ncbi:MAG: hypothetical protein U0X39_15490 [Bacteroidales bacterium]